MLPTDISPLEARQFDLLIRKGGADPASFSLRKFRAQEGASYRVRVVGRGAATVYDTPDAGSWIGDFARDIDKGLFGNDPNVDLPQSLRPVAAEVEKALAQAGLAGALGILNRRVPHRFTAVYRLFGQDLHNIATVDKHPHLAALDLKVVSLKDSFCQFVLRDSLFLSRETGSDARLAGHPYSGIVGSYGGVRIEDREGKLVGTLCHFDLDAHDVTDDEYLLLASAAALMPAFLKL